jgi:glutathione S-transferase
MGEQTRTEHKDRKASAGNGGSLLPADQNERFTSRWEEIQASFVDRPQDAVEEADSLVSDLMQRVTSGLSSERQRLEKQWAAGDDVSTEDLRVALTRYRAFFDRLLKT